MIDLNRFEAARCEYQAWKLADEELMKLCCTYPDHNNLSAINAKLLIVGRAYASGIERNVQVDGVNGNAITRVSAHLHAHRQEVDELIGSLPVGVSTLSENMLEPILDAHGAMVDLLSRVTRKQRSVRSFASKYLHFHRPFIPLYDSYVDKVIPRLVPWKAEIEVISCRETYDEWYYRYLMRFWHLYQHALDAGVQPTVKELDYYLMCEAGQGWTAEAARRD